MVRAFRMNLSAPRPEGRNMLKVHPEPRLATPPSKMGLRAVEWVKMFWSFALFLLFLISVEAASQPLSSEENLQIRLGEVTFRTREIEVPSLKLKILEAHIEVLNRSRQWAAPSNSIKVSISVKEVRLSEGVPTKELSSQHEETMLPVALPPGTGRIVIVGFPLPDEKLESITFEVQVNPPEGEKRTVSADL
jgi:hypothetical protein